MSQWFTLIYFFAMAVVFITMAVVNALKNPKLHNISFLAVLSAYIALVGFAIIADTIRNT